MTEPKYVNWDGLKYYDNKIKQYVDDKITTVEDLIVDKDDIKELSDSVVDLRVDVSNNTTKIENIDRRLDADEAKISVLETKINKTATQIAAIETELEHTLTTEALAPFATKRFVADAIATAQLSGTVDLSNYATKTDVELAKSELETQIAVADRAIEDAFGEINESKEIIKKLADDIYTNHLDIDAVEEALISKADKKDLVTKTSELINDSGFIPSSALESYYTRSETDAAIKESLEGIEIPDVSGLATKEELEAVQNVAGSNSVKLFAIESDLVDINQQLENIPTVDPTKYATREEVATLTGDVKLLLDDVKELKESTQTDHKTLENVQLELVNKVDKSYVDEAIANVEHPTVNLDGYATEQWVNEQGYLKEHQDLSEYAKKSEVPSIEGLATEDFVKSEIAKAELNGGEVTEEELENLLSNYYNKSEVDALIPEVPTKVSELTNDAEFITEENLSDYAKRDELFSKDYNDLINTPEIPSVEGLASEQFVTDAIANIPTPDLANYFTKDETTSAINEAIQGIEIPEVDLTPYATKEQVAAKADNVLFTNDMRVTMPVGSFVEQESVQNLTITEIITKLLGLTLYIPPVTPEGVLEGTPESAVTIITSEIPAHMLTNDGIVAVPYEYRILTTEEGAQDNQSESFLYQIVDESNIAVETGYQIVTQELTEGWVTICIPETITKFSVKIYDGMAGAWVTPEWKLLPNTEQSVDGYVVYTADPEYDIYESTSLRIVIED